MRNYQHAQFEAGFKKGYATLQHIAQIYLRENGTFYPDGLNTMTSGWLKDFANYAKAKKTSSPNILYPKGNYSFHGKASDDITGYYPDAYILDSGEIIMPGTWYGEPSNVWIDTNGIKPPNRFGYDLFKFWLDDDKGILPSGMPGTVAAATSVCSVDVQNSSLSARRNGWGCAYKAITDSNYFKNLPK